MSMQETFAKIAELDKENEGRELVEELMAVLSDRT